MPDLLIVAAFPPELSALRDRAGAGALDESAGALGGRDFLGTAVGIGLVSATAGAAAALVAHAPRAVVLVGTCGVYPGVALDLGGVVRARRVKVADPGVASGASAFPDPMRVAYASDARLREGLSGGPRAPREVDVATTLAVTTDDALAEKLRDAAGAEVEHLEAAGVAAACDAAGVRFAAVFGVANVVGSRGRAQWRAGHQRAGDAAVEHVLDWIERGAPGL